MRSVSYGPSHGTFVTVHDAASGAILADLAFADRSIIRWRADGAALLDIGWGQSNIVLIIEGGRFRVAGKDWEPIASIAARIEAERAEMGGGGWSETVYSPDGRIRIDYGLTEWRMSHWSKRPVVTDLETGKIIFSVDENQYDGSETWRDDGCFDLGMRHYDRGGYVGLRFDPAAGTVAILPDAEKTYPIAEAGSLFKRRFRQSTKEAAKTSAKFSGPSRKGEVLSWSAIGLLLLGAIALGMWLSDYRARQSAQQNASRFTPPPMTFQPLSENRTRGK